MKPYRANPGFHFDVHFLTLGLFKQKIIVGPNCNITPFTSLRVNMTVEAVQARKAKVICRHKHCSPKTLIRTAGQLGVPHTLVLSCKVHKSVLRRAVTLIKSNLTMCIEHISPRSPCRNNSTGREKPEWSLACLSPTGIAATFNRECLFFWRTK